MIITRKIPATPLLLQNGTTVLNEKMSVQDASALQQQLEELYIEYYGSGCLGWTTEHMHDVDRDAYMALEAMIEASLYGY